MAETSFEDLREILNFVSFQIRIKPAIFDKFITRKKQAMLHRLVQCLRNPGMNESQTVKSLFGKVKHTGNYRHLKMMLKRKLLNLVFMSDNELALRDDYFKRQYRMKRDLTAAEFFLVKGMRSAAITLLRQALKTAYDLEETQAAVICLKHLGEHAAYYGWGRKVVEYEKQSVLLQRLLTRESAIVALYHRTLSYAAKKSGYSPADLKNMKRLFEKAKRMHSSAPSYSIRLAFARIAVLYCQGCDAHEKVIRECRKFMSYLDKQPQLYQGARYGEFAVYEMDSHTRLRQFKAGRQCALRCILHLIPGSTPWIQSREYYFLFAMRTRHIDEALKIHAEATSSAQFKKLPPLQQERWRIHQAFLNFELPGGISKGAFNLSKFLNEVPLANRDKPGYNFMVWVAQIIQLISTGNRSRLLDIESAFRDYHRRYIKRKQYPRHYYFGKMLQRLLRNNFSFDDPYIKNIFILLKGSPERSASIEETEVIPYEKLWEILPGKTRCLLKATG